MSLESWPPCHASGDFPGSSVRSCASPSASAQRSPTPKGCPGSASSPLATTIDGQPMRPRSSSDPNGWERGTACRASATASRCSCCSRRWRMTRSDRVVPGLRDAGEVVRLHEPLDPVAAQALGEAVPAGQALVASRLERRGDEHGRRDAVGARDRQARDRVGAHRGAGEDRALDAELVEHRLEVVGEDVVAVGVRQWRGRGLAVAAGVVGDDAVPGALERLGPHDDVAAGRGEAVQQDDRAFRRRCRRRRG